MDTLAICPQCQTLNRVKLDSGSEQPTCGRCKADLPVHEGVQELGGASLKALIEKSPHPVAVDFWAPWCGPCQAFAPIYRQAAHDLAGDVVLVKLNVEADSQASAAYGIRGIPTLAVFRNGREVDRRTGTMPHGELVQYLRQWVETAKSA